MLTLSFFASIREAAGRSQNEMELPEAITNVRELVDYLISRESEALSLLGDEAQVLIAVIQTVVDRSYPLNGNEEVAFFPPMTGG